MERPHALAAHARLARMLMVRPTSSAAITAQTLVKRYQLEWTPSLKAIVRANVASELAKLGNDDAAQQFNEHVAPTPDLPPTAWIRDVNSRSVRIAWG